MKLRYSGTLAITAMIAVACGTGGASPTPAVTAPPSASAAPSATAGATATPGGSAISSVKIGIELPLSGGEVANGEPTKNGILLAIAQWNEGDHAYTVSDNTQDDALNGVHDPQTGAANMGTLVADAEVVGVVGPFNSNVARAEIPVSNEAGLVQCSPSNTGTDLTKEGSEAYRFNGQDERNYIRVATPDDIQGPAGAQYAYNDLGKTKALIIDDTEAFGVGVANTFGEEFTTLGGTITAREGNDFDVSQSFTAILTANQGNFDVVYFGGTQVTGGGQLRRDMGSAGMLEIPLVGPDGIADLGDVGNEGAFLTLAGQENGANVFGTVAGIHDIPDPQAFADAYAAAYDGDAPGAYSALAYACTQVLLQAIDANIGTAADLAALRDAVRTSVFAGDEWDTVLGTIHFDENGDSSQKFISFYKTRDDGSGWDFDKQQDFGV
ncbi:MAG: branched-chain amino acid transport system substrate-binding protein [Chloroflexota bacterium]|jgi:branched-chain amino acid transport system substrate-binding protein|nr:branched-chain amino acid transport system substrate-binding protein [Chloroflexota bacterium]